MSNRMTITIIGGGHIGLVMAAILACAEIKVYLIEIDKHRLKTIKDGQSPFSETGLNALIKYSLENNSLVPTDSYSFGISNSEIVFSCVGTPDNPDGSFDLSYVFEVAKQASKHMKRNTIFVQKSTVPVGTGNQIEKILVRKNKNIRYVSNPEFLREVHSIYDSLSPDRIVIGGNDKKSVNKIIDLYKHLENKRFLIAKRASIKIIRNEIIYIATSIDSAELIKVSSNAFLAVKISFANSIAKLSDQVDADINEIMDAVGADKRIGRSFLNAGRGFGGGCLPKDVSGLVASGIENGVDLDIIKASRTVNDSMPGYIVEKMRVSIGGTLKNKKIAILGLSFKAGINDIRKSPGIIIANLFIKAGAIVSVYDPQVNINSTDDLDNDISWESSIENAIKDKEALVIATDWEEFLDYEPIEYSRHLNGKKIFFDAMNCFHKPKITSAGLKYVGVGR